MDKKKNNHKSCIVCFLKNFIRLCRIVSFHYIVISFYKLYKDKKEPAWIAEIYVIIFAVFITIGLFTMKGNDLIRDVIIWVAIYRLFDIMVKAGVMIFIDSETIYSDKNPYILLETRNPERWVILNFLNIYEIVVCFAVLYLHWGHNFCDKVDDARTAIYQSILTLTTLGYGDIIPKSPETKLIVIFQLAYFIIFILLVAPRIFSSIRTEK